MSTGFVSRSSLSLRASASPRAAIADLFPAGAALVRAFAPIFSTFDRLDGIKAHDRLVRETPTSPVPKLVPHCCLN